MKNFIKPLCVASLLLAGIAQAQTIDKLGIAQINPKVADAFNVPGTIITFYGEQYVVDKPQICNGPSFNLTCNAFLSHLTNDPGVTLNVNQKVVGDTLVTTVTAHPDGKRFMIAYNQQGNKNTAMDVLHIKRVDNI